MVQLNKLSSRQLKGVVRRASFWLILALLVSITLPHYGEALRYPSFITMVISNLGLERQAFERITYLAPIMWTGYAFGSRAAIITSLVALAAMLPRALLISPFPRDSLFETSAVFIIGIVSAISFDVLHKERERRIYLAALDRVSNVVAQSLHLSQILESSLITIMDVMKIDAALLFLVDEESGELVLAAHEGTSTSFTQGVSRLRLGEGCNGRVAESGELLFIKDAAQDPGLTRELGSQSEICSALVVPLSSKGKNKGTLCVGMHGHREFRNAEVKLLTAIGNQMGVAIENARLYEQLEESETKYRAIFETTGAATIIIEADTIISLANEEFEKLSGYPRKEIEWQKSWTEFVVKDDLERMKEFHRLRRIEPEAAPRNYEFGFQDRCGNARDIFLTVAMIPGTQKSVASLLDITELKQAEIRIKESLTEKEASEKRYRELFENAHDVIWLHDLQLNFIGANKSFFKLTGYTPEELAGMKATDLLPEGCVESIRNAEELFLVNRKPIDHLSEVRLVRKDQSSASVQLSTNPIFSNEQVVGFQHIARDITEQKRMQEDMRFYLEQATRAQEEERKRISHELHDETLQSLVVLSRQLDAIASNKTGLTKDIRIRLEELRQRTISIMQEVRRLSQDLRPAALDRLGLLPALEWLASEMEKYSGINTTVKALGTDRRLPGEVELVLFRITQEALRNVWRHAKAREAKVLLEFEEGKTRVTIRDDGRGFDLAETIGDLVRGGKLGLAGMQERARLVGGTLSVKSQPGKGTSVVVEILV